MNLPLRYSTFLKDKLARPVNERRSKGSAYETAQAKLLTFSLGFLPKVRWQFLSHMLLTYVGRCKFYWLGVLYYVH